MLSFRKAKVDIIDIFLFFVDQNNFSYRGIMDKVWFIDPKKYLYTLPFKFWYFSVFFKYRALLVKQI